MPNTITLNQLLLIICLMGMACNNHGPRKITKGFYYWKTNFKLSNFEEQKLDSFHCKTIYIRFFDIDWNAATNEPAPVAISTLKQPLQNGFSFIPVIFITQDALNKLPTHEVENLAKHFTKLLYEKCVQAKIAPTEIQIDFDWTANNQAKYFQLLKFCKKQNFFKGKTLSCTIRLHQVRATKAGVPPVDKGLLMCYNMGNLKLPGSNNSIIDAQVAERYLDNLQDYPLPLDVALPLFSWSLLYDSQNRFIGILRYVQEKDLCNNSLFYLRAKNMYVVNKDTLWKGYTLQRNETVRYENSAVPELYKLAGLVAKKINGPSFSLLFYHCDSAVLSKYNNYELEKIYHYFD